MIAALSGKLIELEFTRAVVDTSGVGYEVFIPMSTYDKMPRLGENVVLKVLTVVREDAITLYGFHTVEEKALFQLLTTVSGIGPKLSLNVLSALPVPHICGLIASENVKSLTKINGLGKKTAERLVLELKDKVQVISFTPVQPGLGEEAKPVAAAAYSVEVEDAIGALVTLGYKDASARKAVSKLAEGMGEGEATAEHLIRLALQKLNS